MFWFRNRVALCRTSWISLKAKVSRLLWRTYRRIPVFLWLHWRHVLAQAQVPLHASTSRIPIGKTKRAEATERRCRKYKVANKFMTRRDVNHVPCNSLVEPACRYGSSNWKYVTFCNEHSNISQRNGFNRMPHCKWQLFHGIYESLALCGRHRRKE